MPVSARVERKGWVGRLAAALSDGSRRGRPVSYVIAPDGRRISNAATLGSVATCRGDSCDHREHILFLLI